MKICKKDMIQFLVWMRNGIAFCTTWLLILTLVYNKIWGIQTIQTNSLIKMVFFVIGGVFLFCMNFSRAFIKKWRFMKRLTCFMILISVYEIVGFYWLGIFVNQGTVIEWIVFIMIILVLYAGCIGIYQQYSEKKGEFYTQALQKYQQQRSMENE